MSVLGKKAAFTPRELLRELSERRGYRVQKMEVTK